MEIIKRFWSFAVIISVLFTMACKEDPVDPGTDEVPGEELSGTWTVTDANDVTGPAADQFTSFSITITANAAGVTYTTSGGGDPLVFPEQGSLIVEATDNFDEGAEVLREPDNVPLTINLSEDGAVMNMTFTIDVGTTAANGRVAGINGEYNFRLEAQGTN